MKHLTKILLAITFLAFASCSSERYHQFSKIKVKQSEFAQGQKLDNPAQITTKQNSLLPAVVSFTSAPIGVIEKPVKIDSKLAVSNSNIEKIVQKKGSVETETKQVVKQNVLTKSASNSGDLPLDAFALTGFIAGVLGLFLLPFLFGTVAVVFSAIGLARIGKGKSKGKGFAIAGLVLGIISFVWVLIVLGSI